MVESGSTGVRHRHKFFKTCNDLVFKPSPRDCLNTIAKPPSPMIDLDDRGSWAVFAEHINTKYYRIFYYFPQYCTSMFINVFFYSNTLFSCTLLILSLKIIVSCDSHCLQLSRAKAKVIDVFLLEFFVTQVTGYIIFITYTNNFSISVIFAYTFYFFPPNSSFSQSLVNQVKEVVDFSLSV